MNKWTRVKFQPNLPLRESGRVTASKEHILLSKEAAKEGMVLLKNEKNLLPLTEGTRIALFGKGSFDYVKGGGRSGDVMVSYVHNLYDGLKMLAALIKGTIVFLLTAGLLVFVGYLTASGAIAGSADAAAVKAAKMTISRAIPVVGGILSDAAETVLAGAGVLRGTVGVVGMLVVLAICLTPFLQLALHYLTYKGAAALTGTVAGPRLSGLMDNLGGAFGLILGMTGSCALVLLFSIVSAVSAVMG